MPLLQGGGKAGARKAILPKVRSPEECREATQRYLREAGLIKVEETKKHWVDKGWFSGVIGVVIVLNVVLIGVEVDHTGDMTAFNIMNHLFCAIYVLELYMRLKVHGFEYFKQSMNCIDFALVIIGILDNWVIGLIMGDSADLSQILILRALRFLRVVRVIRMLSLFKEMWLIVEGLIRSFRALTWVVFLLTLTLYVCAILATMSLEIMGEPTEDSQSNLPRAMRKFPSELDRQLDLMFPWTKEAQQEYFGTVPRSAFTLFQVMTLDHWATHIVRPISRQYPVVAFFVFVFLLIGAYALLNVVVGVLVQNTVELAQNRENRASKLIEGEQKKLIYKLKDFFVACDTNNNGILEKEELDEAVQNPRIIRAFKQIDLPVQDFDALFHLLDSDRKLEITFEEFVMGCLKLKTPPSGTDMMKIMVSMGQGVGTVSGVENRCGKLQRDLEGVQFALDGAFRLLTQTSDALSARIPEVDLRRTGKISRNKEMEAKRLQQAKMRTAAHHELHSAGSPIKISQRTTNSMGLLKSRVEGSFGTSTQQTQLPSSTASQLLQSN